MASPIGNPKYLKGVLIISQFNTDVKLIIFVCFTPTPPILLLRKFTLRSETNSKQLNMTLMLNTRLIFVLQKNKVSSAYCSIFTFTDYFPISKPSINSFSTAILDTPARLLATIIGTRTKLKGRLV